MKFKKINELKQLVYQYFKQNYFKYKIVIYCYYQQTINNIVQCNFMLQ